jgi:hypothetical protein
MALASPIQATEVLSDPGFSATPIEKCNNALNTCSLYVTHLTGSVERLQKLAKMYKDQRDLAIVQAGKNLNDAGLPSWAWAAIGAVAASGLWGIFYYNRSQH